MNVPLPWANLIERLNGRAGFIGTAGVRDPEHPCEVFDGEGYDGGGDCLSDGHYLCVECSELSPDAPRFQEYGAAGRLDRIRALRLTQRRRGGGAVPCNTETR